MTSALRRACLLGPLVACGAETPRGLSPPSGSAQATMVPLPSDGFPAPGEPCNTDAPACGREPSGVREPVLLRCTSGMWSAGESCIDVCARSGSCSAGCAVTREGADCLCVSGGSSCGQLPWCASQARLAVPDGDDIDCMQQCRSGGDASFSSGCGVTEPSGPEGCICAELGDTCDPAWTGGACVGPALPSSTSVVIFTEAIARCVSGVWEAESCVDRCKDPLAVCRGSASEAHACSCELD